MKWYDFNCEKKRIIEETFETFIKLQSRNSPWIDEIYLLICLPKFKLLDLSLYIRYDL